MYSIFKWKSISNQFKEYLKNDFSSTNTSKLYFIGSKTYGTDKTDFEQ